MAWANSRRQLAVRTRIAVKHTLILFLFFTRMYPEVGIALPVAVTFLIVGRSPPPLIATYATLITVPVVLVTYLVQRWIKADYLAGAVKG